VWKAIVPLALAILFVAFLFGGVLTVRNIRVTGNARISAEEIIRLSKLKLGQSSLINEKEISNRIEQNPYLICRMVSPGVFPSPATRFISSVSHPERNCRHG
jgi:cell division septal protein FtsQ